MNLVEENRVSCYCYKKKNMLSHTLQNCRKENKNHKDSRLNTKNAIIFYSFIFHLVREKLYAIGLGTLQNIEKSINQIN